MLYLLGIASDSFSSVLNLIVLSKIRHGISCELFAADDSQLT